MLEWSFYMHLLCCCAKPVNLAGFAGFNLLNLSLYCPLKTIYYVTEKIGSSQV